MICAGIAGRLFCAALMHSGRWQVNSAGTFEATGLTLSIMNLCEFWAGEIFITSTHLQWSTLCCTSSESLLTSFQNLLKRSLWNGLMASGFRCRL